MQITPNNNIKIIRFHGGEDIMANYIVAQDNETAILENPMQVIFKRIATGQTVMMMMPWLPIEIIKENSAVIYTSDILTMIEPKDDLIEYYGNIVIEAQKRMENKLPIEEDDDIMDENIDDEEQWESLRELMLEKKKGSIH
jgi:hypothetical protein